MTTDRDDALREGFGWPASDGVRPGSGVRMRVAGRDPEPADDVLPRVVALLEALTALEGVDALVTVDVVVRLRNGPTADS